MKDDSLVQLIERAGLTNKEAKVYLALLELGSGDVTDIAGISGLKRPIIYVILEGLTKRGYASRLPGNKVNRFQAADPSVFLRELKEAARDLSQMLPLLNAISSHGTARPKIRYIDELSGIWNVLEEMNQSDEPFFITSYSKIERMFPQAVDRWLKNYENGLYRPHGRHLLPNQPEELEMGRRLLACSQQVRTLNGFDLDIDISLFGDKLSFSSLSDKPFMIVVESQSAASSMRQIFELLWSQGQNI